MKITVLPYLLVLMTKLMLCTADMEPKCSKFDFEEKLLEKMVRMEHENKLMMEDFMKISQQVKEDQRHVNEEVVKMKTEFGEIQRQANEDSSKQKRLIEEYLRRSSYTFSTIRLANTDPAIGDVLVFTRTQLNEGNVYDSSTGKYTAPLNGTYLFATTLCFKPAKWAFIHFMADDMLIGAFLAGNESGTGYKCSSSTVTAFLQKDMEVWLKVYGKNSETPFHNSENYNNSFAGHLIKEA